MMSAFKKFQILGGAVIALAALAGCGGKGGGSVPSLISPSSPAANTGTSARFHVDVNTGKVTIVNNNGSSSAANRTIFAGTSIAFNSSNLFTLAGNNGVRVLSVSLTNNSGLAIGTDSNGNTNGLNVIFSNFSNVGLFPNVTTLTSVSTVATGFNQPFGVAAAGNGVYYVADTFNNVIKKVSGGVTTVLAGNGISGEVDGTGTGAEFSTPVGIAVSPVDGSLIVADYFGPRIRRVTPAGRVTTVAGAVTGNANGTGNVASFGSPWGVAIDPTGVIYVTEIGNSDVRKIQLTGLDPTLSSSYTVSTLAGGTTGSADGTGSSAQFSYPKGIVYSSGTLYVADFNNNKIRAISATGTVTTVAGTGAAGIVDGVGNAATLFNPTGITAVNGSLIVSEGYITSGDENLRQISPIAGASTSTSAGWETATIAGAGTAGSTNGAGNVAQFNNPCLISSDPSGNVLLADTGNNALREISPSNGVFPVGIPTTGTQPTEPVQLSNATGQADTASNGGATTAGLPYINFPGALANGATSTPQQWWFSIPSGVNAFEYDVTVQAAAAGLIPPGAGTGQGDPTEQVSTFAGAVLNAGNSSGIPTHARFSNPLGVTYYSSTNSYDTLNGCVFIADQANQTVRIITPAGQVATIAGGAGRSLEDGAGNVAGFSTPNGLTVGPADSLYLTDTNLIRLISFSGGDPTSPVNWTVTTIAGNGSSTFGSSNQIVRDPSGDLYVSDYVNNDIKRIQFIGGDPTQTANYSVTTFAGSGASGHANGTGTAATFNHPQGITQDSLGNLYVADYGNDEIRKITPDAVVTTVAGIANTAGYTDGANGISKLEGPTAISVDSANYVYFTDGAFLVRRLSPNAVTSTVAGTNSSSANPVDGAGNTALFVKLGGGLTVNPGGDIYLTDDDAIRLIQKQITVGANAKPAVKK